MSTHPPGPGAGARATIESPLGARSVVPRRPRAAGDRTASGAISPSASILSYPLADDPAQVASRWPTDFAPPSGWTVHAHPDDEAAARAWLSRLSAALDEAGRRAPMTLRLDAGRPGSLRFVPGDGR